MGLIANNSFAIRFFFFFIKSANGNERKKLGYDLSLLCYRFHKSFESALGSASRTIVAFDGNPKYLLSDFTSKDM